MTLRMNLILAALAALNATLSGNAHPISACSDSEEGEVQIRSGEMHGCHKKKWTKIPTDLLRAATPAEACTSAQLASDVALVSCDSTDYVVFHGTSEERCHVEDSDKGLLVQCGEGNEVALHHGLPGDVGPSGPQGEQGPRGPEGPEGPLGLRGLTGEAGPEGAVGEKGPIGSRGEMGPLGDMGPRGDNGPGGFSGNKGAMGLKGIDGDAGDMGPGGEPGNRGPSGPAGRDCDCP